MKCFDYFIKNINSGFTSILFYMLIGATLRDLCNMGLKGRIFGHQSRSKIPFFSHFLNKFPLVSHNSYFICSLGGTFMCISMMCPKAPISGPKVKVAAELVGPSGLLLHHVSSCTGTVWTFRTSVLCCAELSEDLALSRRGSSGMSTPETVQVWCVVWTAYSST